MSLRGLKKPIGPTGPSLPTRLSGPNGPNGPMAPSALTRLSLPAKLSVLMGLSESKGLSGLGCCQYVDGYLYSQA